MLDNLGFGEIFFLGLLLFLFLGPERLPQLGARLGRWVSNLTRYSGAFMNEWREEALAVHDAMEQVRGMRDEIAAARAEIAGTLYEARDDLGEAVEGARQDVGQQVQRATHFVPQELPSTPGMEAAGALAKGLPASSAAGSEGPAHGAGTARARTQQVIDDLLAKRASSAKPPRVAREETSSESALVEGQVSAEGPSAADVARLRDQVHDLGAEVEVLRAAVAEVREALEERVPAVVSWTGEAP